MNEVPTPRPPPDSLGLGDLHPRIQHSSGSLYRDKHYASAILEAYKSVEILVRELTGLEASGNDLMAQALTGEHPMLSVAVEPGASGRNEQEGFRFLLMGAMQGIRNPKAHEIVDQRDPIRTLEYLAFASLLTHRLEAAEVHRPG